MTMPFLLLYWYRRWTKTCTACGQSVDLVHSSTWCPVCYTQLHSGGV